MNQNQRFGNGQMQMMQGQHPPGMNDPRFSHYGRTGGSNPHYGRDDRDKRSRHHDGDDRSSNRYGGSDDRDRRHKRRRSRSRSYSSSRSRSTSSEYRRRRRSRSRSRDRSRRHRDSRRSSSHRDSNKHASAPYGMGATMAPGMLPPPPPPPPPRRPNMPMQMGQQIPGPFPGQTPQMMPGSMQQPMQQPQQQMGVGQQGQYYQHPQQPMYSNNNNVSQQVQSMNNAALGQALMPQGMMGMQAQGIQVNHPPMSQNQGQGVLDILALADKASQALSSVQVPVPALTSNPNFPPPPMQSFQQNNFAGEQDLSTLVQYALQNLRTTGHVEQHIDGKICSMLKRLPENAALQALETFSSCDVSKMRSKGGYLAGILKKELTKLGL